LERCLVNWVQYSELKSKGRRLSRDHPLIKSILDERPDLRDVFERVPVWVVPEGEIERVTGKHAVGLYFWRVGNDGRVEPVSIFIEEPKSTFDILRRTIKHEACHAKVSEIFPRLYPYFSWETSEKLAELCVEDKLPLSTMKADFQAERELSNLVMREGIREAIKDAVWRLGREKCEVTDEESKRGLNRAIDAVLEKALEIDVLDFADREEIREAANKAKKLCLESKL